MGTHKNLTLVANQGWCGMYVSCVSEAPRQGEAKILSQVYHL